MRSTATGSFLMEKTPDMPDDPRPEPVEMTDDGIAKLAPLKGEESFSVRFAVNVDLEPNCKGPVPFLGALLRAHPKAVSRPLREKPSLQDGPN